MSFEGDTPCTFVNLSITKIWNAIIPFVCMNRRTIFFEPVFTRDKLVRFFLLQTVAFCPLVKNFFSTGAISL